MEVPEIAVPRNHPISCCAFHFFNHPAIWAFFRGFQPCQLVQDFFHPRDITQVRLPHPDSPGGLRLRAAAARESSAGGEGGRAAPGGPRRAERRKRAPGCAGRGLPPARTRVENGCFGEKTRHVDGDGLQWGIKWN